MPTPIDRTTNIADAKGCTLGNLALEDLDSRPFIGHSPLAIDFHKPLWDQSLWLTEQLRARLQPAQFLINGSMRLLQRFDCTHNTFSTITADTCGADRWKCSRENTDLQVARYDTNSGGIETGLRARYYARYKKITTLGKLFIRQILTGNDSAALRGRTITFQIKLKSDANRTIKIGVLELNSSGTIDTVPATPSAWNANSTDPTFGTNVAKIAPIASTNSTIVSSAASCAVTTAWQNFSVTVTLPSNSKNFILAVWSDSQVAINGILNLAEAMLTDASAQNDFNPRDYLPPNEADEFLKASRFYCKTYDPNIVPGANDVNSAMQYFAFAAGVKNGGLFWRFPVPLRVIPSMTFYNPLASNGNFYNVTQSADSSGAAASSTGTAGVTIVNSQLAGDAIGDQLAIHAAAEAEL